MTKQKPLAPRWANDHTKELNKYFVQGAFVEIFDVVGIHENLRDIQTNR